LMRNETIDVAKGIGILLVVLGHNWIANHGNGELFRIIFSFHMVLFFFLSGIFLNPRKSLTTTARQKAHSLLKPYFVVLLAIAAEEVFFDGALPLDNLLGVAFASSQSILWAPLWFLPHLFLTTVFSFLIVTAIGPKTKTWPIACAVVVVLLLLGIASIRIFSSLNLGTLEIKPGWSRELTGLPFSADVVLITSAYVIAGYVLAEQVKNFRTEPLWLFLALSVFSCCHMFFDETMNLAFRVYGNPVISTAQAITGIYITLCLSDLTAKLPLFRRSLSYIGSGSLFILIFHGILQGKATSMAHSLIPSHLALGAALGLVAAVTSSLLIWEAAKRIPLASLLLLEKHDNFGK